MFSTIKPFLFFIALLNLLYVSSLPMGGSKSEDVAPLAPFTDLDLLKYYENKNGWCLAVGVYEGRWVTVIPLCSLDQTTEQGERMSDIVKSFSHNVKVKDHPDPSINFWRKVTRSSYLGKTLKLYNLPKEGIRDRLIRFDFDAVRELLKYVEDKKPSKIEYHGDPRSGLAKSYPTIWHEIHNVVSRENYDDNIPGLSLGELVYVDLNARSGPGSYPNHPIPMLSIPGNNPTTYTPGDIVSYSVWRIRFLVVGTQGSIPILRRLDNIIHRDRTCVPTALLTDDGELERYIYTDDKDDKKVDLSYLTISREKAPGRGVLSNLHKLSKKVENEKYTIDSVPQQGDLVLCDGPPLPLRVAIHISGNKFLSVGVVKKSADGEEYPLNANEDSKDIALSEDSLTVIDFTETLCRVKPGVMFASKIANLQKKLGARGTVEEHLAANQPGASEGSPSRLCVPSRLCDRVKNAFRSPSSNRPR